MQQWQQLIAIIKKEVKPALGCTEPTSIAYACAHAARILGQKPEKLHVFVSDNLYKNAMGVFVPGTGKIGLPIAASVGALGGNPDAGLEVLAGITTAQVKEALEMIEAGHVKIDRADSNEEVFCRAIATVGNDSAEVTVSGGHTDIVETRKNNEVLFKKETDIKTDDKGSSSLGGEEINLKMIYDFALNVPMEDIRFILQARDINMALAEEGLAHEYGLELGRTIREQIQAGIMGTDLINNMAAYTAAASDARMGGATLPAMSNYGSGNQGITATIPVVKMAEFVGADEEHLARALILSHLGAIYIKSHYPSLSAFCGNTATSSAVSMVTSPGIYLTMLESLFPFMTREPPLCTFAPIIILMPFSKSYAQIWHLSSPMVVMRIPSIALIVFSVETHPRDFVIASSSSSFLNVTFIKCSPVF